MMGVWGSEGPCTLFGGWIAGRCGHFMPTSLLESQFAALETPTNRRIRSWCRLIADCGNRRVHYHRLVIAAGEHDGADVSASTGAKLWKGKP